MKTSSLVVLKLAVLILVSNGCQERRSSTSALNDIEIRLKDITMKLTILETTDNLDTFMEYYDSGAISMPEYQLTLRGRDEIKAFYREIFFRQKIKKFQRTSREFIHLDKTVVEIGTFEKEYAESKTDSLLSMTGKYWMVWCRLDDGSFKLKGEAFGFFHQVEHPESLIVPAGKMQPNESEILQQKEIPFELKAYNALMEKGVRTRNGNPRSDFFTMDGTVYPFADSTVAGMEQIRPYLIEYCSRGTVTIDSIMCYTYDFEMLGEHILEYDMFKVKWSVPNFSGRTEGKGIRIWKRQPGGSLRLYREIGTHNHL